MSSSTKTFLGINEKYDRVVVLIDMDAFYTQVEEYLDPDRLKGKPIAVVQYVENAGIIAVNYPAKDLGVTRHMRENEAKSVCSELICVKVPSKNGKADLTKYRDAGCRVAKVLQSFTPLLERASVDEAYLDITELVIKKLQDLKNKTFQLSPKDFENTFAVGYETIGQFVQDVTNSVDKPVENVDEADRIAYASSKLRLLIGASIVNEIRRAVKSQTNYECSAGIAHNKILAKLCCAFNKPNKQTIVPIDSVAKLFKELPVSKVKSLGGKLGEEICQKLNVKTMGDILKFSEIELQSNFQVRVGSWLYWMARGIDLEKVTPKFMSKSIAVSKNFRGKNEITSIHTLKYWLRELAKEIVERLQKDELEYNRTARHMVVTFNQGEPRNDKKVISSSRTIPLNGAVVNVLTSDQIADFSFDTIKRNTPKFLKNDGTAIMYAAIKLLGINVGKFEEKDDERKNKQNLFANHKKRKATDEDSAKTSTSSKRQSIEKQQKSKSPEAENKLPTEPPPPTVETLKKFEMKSPKPVMKVSSSVKNFLKETSNITKVDDKVDEFLIRKVTFKTENAIRGIKNLRHWILELSHQLFKDISEDSRKNFRSPTFFIIEIFHENSEISPIKEKISFDDIEDEVINMNSVLENSNFTKKIENPIIKIETTAREFVKEKLWRFKLMEEKVEIEGVNESFNDQKHHQEESEDLFQDSTIEFDSTIPENGNSEKVQVDESHGSVKNESKMSSSPTYSPEHEIFEDENVVENIPEYSDEPMPSTSYNYTTTYAEFQTPNIPLDAFDEKEKCEECGRMISRFDMTEHLDRHLAFMISQKQRVEYRQSQTKPSTSTQQSKSKKIATKTNNNKKPNLAALTSSVKKFTVNLDEQNDDSMRCSQCLKMIPIDEIEAHKDYHYACDLSKSLNNSSINGNSSTSKSDKKSHNDNAKSNRKSKAENTMLKFLKQSQ